MTAYMKNPTGTMLRAVKMARNVCHVNRHHRRPTATDEEDWLGFGKVSGFAGVGLSGSLEPVSQYSLRSFTNLSDCSLTRRTVSSTMPCTSTLLS